VRIDKTAPNVTVKVDPSVLWPPNHQLVDVTATVAVRDSLSGADGFALVSVESNERCDRDHDDPDDVVGWRPGTDDTRGKLRAEKSEHGAERVYTLTYRGKDQAGNDAIGKAYVRVTKR